MKNELKTFKRMLSPDYEENFESKEEDESDARGGALKMALHFLRKMKLKYLANKLQQSKNSSFIYICIFFLSSVSVTCKTLLCFILFFENR